MRKIGIIGVGEYLPKKILTNFDLEKMVETSDEWITQRTGIKERRIASEKEATSDLAVLAAKDALKDAKLLSKDVELIIVATITPDMQFPSTACIVQEKLQNKKAACFDISAACAGFVYGVVTAQAFISQGIYKNALVIGAEKLSSITDWTDRNTCVLLGDGAGACVLAEVDEGGILSSYLGSDGTQGDLLYLPGGGSKYPATHKTIEERMHYIKMKGSELFKIAVVKMTESAQKALEKINLTCKDIDWLIPHQANMRILLAVAKKMGLDKNKVYLNIERYGNMSSASTATALCEAVREKKIKKGNIVVLDAFGGGLVWGACVIRW